MSSFMSSFVSSLSTSSKVQSLVIVKTQIGRLTERETKENEAQGERVTECEATVARQGAYNFDLDAYQKWEVIVKWRGI